MNTRAETLTSDSDVSAAKTEAKLLRRLADNQDDRAALLGLGHLSRIAGRYADAHKYLSRAQALYPDDTDIARARGDLFFAQDDHAAAETCFVIAGGRKATPEARSYALHLAGYCNLHLGRPTRALKFYISAGIFPASAIAFLSEPETITDQDIARLNDDQATRLMELTYHAGQNELALRIGYDLKNRGDNLSTNETLGKVLPKILWTLNRPEEGGRIYLEIVRAGGYAADYRPRWSGQHLPRFHPPVALELFETDRRRFQKRRIAAAQGIAPGCTAITGAAGAIGLARVWLAGTVTSTVVGAQYRFEYGADPERLDTATAWKDVPPPRSARIHQRAARHFEWLPLSTQISWSISNIPSPQGPADDIVLRMTGPFATDRNQMNGIGRHEMLLGMRWAQDPQAVIGDDSLGATGGVMDLRDAEFSMTLRGDNVDLASSSLTFWAARSVFDKDGVYSCGQWALTGAVFPDEALESGRWSKTTLTLRNDPRQWTYTGNNPEEQGKRAARYRHMPLDLILSRMNHVFVLTFAMDDENAPPCGSVEVRDVTVKLRNPSALSPAAGSTLTLAPPQGDDPLKLTNGARGRDEDPWTSGPRPAFPLIFAWDLPRPITLTHIQFSQHPYWPAKDVEVLVRETDGTEHVLHRETLKAMRPSDGEPTQLTLHFLPRPGVTAVTLRILSAYDDEYCGLESFDVFGEGVLFKGDGQLCSVGEEIGDLPPGERLYYRIALREAAHEIVGFTRVAKRPAHQVPVIEDAVPFARTGSPPCFRVRANAMGLETTLWAEVRPADGSAPVLTPRTPLGCQPTARHIYLTPHGVPAAGEMILHAENAAGVCSFPVAWPIRATGSEIAFNPLVEFSYL